MNKIARAATDLFETCHRGQPWRTINLDDWTLSGSRAQRHLIEVAAGIDCDPMEIVRAAQALIAEDQADYDAA